jgi:hypothetical protein
MNLFQDLFDRQKRHFATGVTTEKNAAMKMWFEYRTLKPGTHMAEILT